MWKLTFNLLLALTLVMAFGCRPPEEETQYSIASFVNPLQSSACMIEADDSIEDAQEIEQCSFQQGCQAVLDEGDNYLGCMPTPLPEDEAAEDGDVAPPVDGDDDDDYTPPANEDEDDDYTPPTDGEVAPPVDGDEADDERKNACSDPEKHNHKVLVCHDTSSKKKGSKHHTICIAKQAWEHAHKQNSHHEGRDYLGACAQEDLDQ